MESAHFGVYLLQFLILRTNKKFEDWRVLTWFTIFLVHDAIEDTVPASRGRHLEQEDHALTKRLEIVNFVQGST